MIENCRICNKKINADDSIHGICKECFENTAATFNKEDYLKSDYSRKFIFKHTCIEDNNHIFLSRGPNDKNCPLCKTEDVFCANCCKKLDFKVSKNAIKNNRYFCLNNGRCASQFNIKVNKSSGFCSICGKPNKKRDQNARGKDSFEGDNFINYKTNEVIRDYFGSIIANIGDICGCDCSRKEYKRINNDSSHINASKQNIINWNNSKKGRGQNRRLNE